MTHLRWSILFEVREDSGPRNQGNKRLILPRKRGPAGVLQKESTTRKLCRVLGVARSAYHAERARSRVAPPLGSRQPGSPAMLTPGCCAPTARWLRISRAGSCYGNARMERCWATLKTELGRRPGVRRARRGQERDLLLHRDLLPPRAAPRRARLTPPPWTSSTTGTKHPPTHHSAWSSTPGQDHIPKGGSFDSPSVRSGNLKLIPDQFFQSRVGRRSE